MIHQKKRGVGRGDHRQAISFSSSFSFCPSLVPSRPRSRPFSQSPWSTRGGMIRGLELRRSVSSLWKPKTGQGSIFGVAEDQPLARPPEAEGDGECSPTLPQGPEWGLAAVQFLPLSVEAGGQGKALTPSERGLETEAPLSWLSDWGSPLEPGRVVA